MSPGEGGATVFDLSVGLGFSLVVRQDDEGFEIVVWSRRKFRYELGNILILMVDIKFLP